MTVKLLANIEGKAMQK